MNLSLLTICALGVASALSLGPVPLLPLPGWAVFCTLAGASVLIVGFVLLLPWLPRVARHTDFVAVTRRHLQRFAPLYFVAGPPAVAYFAMCGGLSIVAFLGFETIEVRLLQHHLDTLQQWKQHGIAAVLKGVGYGVQLRWSIRFCVDYPLGGAATLLVRHFSRLAGRERRLSDGAA